MKNVLISAMAGALMGALVCALSLGGGPLPWLAAKVAGPADASQNALSSPATGTVSGLQLTNNYNNALDSLNTCNSGTSAPTNQLSGSPSEGNCWINTTSNPHPHNVYDGANWLAPYYVDTVNHLILNQVGGGTANVTSATTTSLCSVPQYFLTITGTTTITGFGTGCFAGQEKRITFSGVLTLTYNATSMIIPGAANVVTAAGDTAIAVYLGSGNWNVASYQPATGAALVNPSIDLGAVEWTFSPNVPSAKYLWAYGQAISRTTYATLMTALTITQSVTATNGSPTLTGFSDTTQIANGSKVEGAFIPSNTSVSSCTSTTCTLNKNATASTTGNVQIFNYGNGDGSTTFNLPDCRGAVFAGRDNMGGTARGILTSGNYGTNPDALGASGGAQSQTIAQANLPNINFPSTLTISGNISGSVVVASTVNGGAGSPNIVAGTCSNCYAPSSQTVNGSSFAFSGAVSGGAVSSGGSGTALTTIQPTITANCMIRVLAMLDVDDRPAANDDFAPILGIDPRRRTA